MRKLLALIAFFVAMFVSSCSKFDDTQIWDKINDHEQRISRLEELCQQMNSNISSLQTIVSALQNNDYVTAVTPVTKDGKTIGYTIAFTKSAPITIYHGEDGKDGANGKDGINGYTPIIGVKQDSNGIYYWTINGEWLTDEDGNKIKAVGTDGKDGINGEDGSNGEDGINGNDGVNGKDGVTPQLKIENEYWYISYDNGSTWTILGRATGNDGVNGTNGKDGDSFFQSVDTSNGDYVIFTLSDGTQIKLPTWYAFEQLRVLCNQMNTNISSLQTIVSALQNNDYITTCVPLMENGVQIGYTITFAKSGSIVIYHGKDGENGSNGDDGKDGVDGLTPIIGVRTNTDGITYWTLNGEWLLDEKGNKVRVNGKDGVDGTDGSNGKDAIIPQLKVENSYWYISYDNGASWTQLGKATGEDGKDGTNGTDGIDGDSFFQSITQDEDYVYLTLSTGEKIDIPKHHPLSVSFTETEDIRVLADKTYTIGYTITGADDNTVIKALAQDGFRAVVKKSDNATGIIEITTPPTILPTEILIFVTDGKERTIMRSINFVEGVIIVSSKSYTIDYAGGTLEVSLSTNIDYTIEIPEADQSWISVAETRADMRDETLTFTVAKNEAQSVRYTTVKLIDDLGVVSETILITQKAGISKTLHIATAGTLDTLISSNEKGFVEELTLTGNLNTFDFDFIRTMSNLKLLDISGTTNTSLPAGCFMNSTISTVLLPLELKSISNRAFYQSKITSLYIPECVQTIGDYAFYQCKKVKGDLIIPDATTSVGNYCFQESSFNGKLKLGNKLSSIGEYAFSKCTGFTGDLMIPDSVTTLGQYAFNECTGFTGDLTISDNLTEIANYTFFGCSNLSGSISIGVNVTSIGIRAFAGNSSLTGNLVIPDKVKTIGAFAFTDCRGLTGYLYLGSQLERIGEAAFVSCEGTAKWRGTDGYSSLDGITYKYGNLYYYPTVLNFSRIYCSATNPPIIHKIDAAYYGYVSSIDCYNYLMRLDPERMGAKIGSFTSWMNVSGTSYSTPTKHKNLFVKIGTAQAYNDKESWSSCFSVIEETNF